MPRTGVSPRPTRWAAPPAPATTPPAARPGRRSPAAGAPNGPTTTPAGSPRSRSTGGSVSSVDRDLRSRRVRITDRTRADGRVSVHQLEWNRRDQLVRRDRDGEAVTWAYDAAGRRTAMTTPTARRRLRATTRASRLTASTTRCSAGRLHHDASGRLAAATAGDCSSRGVRRRFRHRPHRHRRRAGRPAPSIDRDDDGRIVAIRRPRTAVESTRFDYDAARQLVAAQSRRPGSTSWHYDTAGRLVAETHGGGRARLRLRRRGPADLGDRCRGHDPA